MTNSASRKSIAIVNSVHECTSPNNVTFNTTWWNRWYK